MIGERIKKLRVEQNQSASELARTAGVSKSLISQIEHGRTNPSVETVRAIASALEVPLFTLFLEDDGPHRGVVRKDERIKISLPGSDAVREVLTPSLANEMVLALSRLGPGGTSSQIPTSHKGEECIFVLKGSVTVHIVDESYVLESGDTFCFDGRLPHRFCNETEKETEILCVLSEGVLPPR